MAIDIDEFARLFESDPVDKVKEVFGVPGPDFKPKVLQWKGKQVTVYDFELFKGIITDWMARDGTTKEEALEEFFSMI